MAKVVDIRTQIEALLKTVHARSYFEKAQSSAALPYVVFDLPNSVDSGDLENFVLDVTSWDSADDTTALETLAENVDAVLHKKAVTVDNSVAFVMYRMGRISNTVDDVNRRYYTYQCRTYGIV